MNVKDFKSSEMGKGRIYERFLQNGFQATEMARAVSVIEEMKKDKSFVYFGFTANLVATGLRGLIMEMCKNSFVDAIVTTSGSIDHDIIRTFQKYEIATFNEDDRELFEKGYNRIGNVLVKSEGFAKLEGKMIPFLKKCLAEKKIWSPSELLKKLGETLDESSFLYWAAKNNIPVYCPGITDGAAFGLQLHFFKEENPDFVIDVTADLKPLLDSALNAEKTGAIILGGGISKHHIIGSNIVREGLDYATYISTAQEFDGSLSGARPKEAKSWGKLKGESKSVHVNCDATIAFPLIYHSLKERGLL
ncbi:MAG: deoxyhypusine synthase [archaeon]|nr:deoxyhypusine synthase [archaeon]